MIGDQGTFLVDINRFLAELHELENILEEYQVDTVTELKKKIENKELPEHPSYEDYLDAIHLFDSLKTKQSLIIQSLQEIELDKLQ